MQKETLRICHKGKVLENVHTQMYMYTALPADDEIDFIFPNVSGCIHYFFHYVPTIQKNSQTCLRMYMYLYMFKNLRLNFSPQSVQV